MYTTEAWVLSRKPSGTNSPQAGELERKSIQISPLEPDEVLVEPIFGSWEANMSHAIQRQPVDICRQRGEDSIVLGNAGVVRVVELGRDVSNVRIGELCLLFGTGRYDQFGYMELAHAYDAPRTVGVLAKLTKIPSRNLFSLPPSSRFSPEQWAAFSVKYLTAWSNWHIAIGCLRLQMREHELPQPHVWGWGGGTTLAELDLAHRAGCKAVLITGSEAHKREAEHLGIETLDRNEFWNLNFDEERFKSDAEYRRGYQDAERKFLTRVRERTQGLGVSIFIDYIGTPVIRATLRALGRQGVITTAGWRHGMDVSLTRAVECIKRHIHVHTHYARPSDVPAAMAYAESTGWIPQISHIYDWSDIPELAREHTENKVGSYFPVFRVNALDN